MKLSFTFNTEPKAIQSVRFARMGRFVNTYQPKSNKDWKNFIKLQALSQLPYPFKLIDEAIAISKCHFIFSPLRSFPKYKLKMIEEGKILYKTTKPDLDSNLLKGLIDALNGIVFKDDSLIVSTNNIKKYYGLEPKIELEIKTINQD